MPNLVICERHGLSYDPEQGSCPACRTTAIGMPLPAPASARDTQRRDSGGAGSLHGRPTTRGAGVANVSLHGSPTTRVGGVAAGSTLHDSPTKRRVDARTTAHGASRRPSRLETQRPRFGPVVKYASVPPNTRLHGFLALCSLVVVAVVAYRQPWGSAPANAARATSGAAAQEPTSGAATPATSPPASAREPSSVDDPASTLAARSEPARALPLIRYRGRHGEVPEVCRVPWLEMYERGRSNAGNGAHGQAPLMAAAEDGSLETLQLLLGQGAEVDARDDLNQTALIYAARGGRTANAQALMRAGADARTRGLGDPRGGSLTALDAALLAGKSETAQRIQEEVLQTFLTLQGPDLEALDEAGETPLHWLANYGGGTTARLLLERGADTEAKSCPTRPGDEHGPHAEDLHSATPLLVAVWAENPAVARQLLEFKANARAVDERGRGAFHVLRHVSSLALTAELLRAGADPMLPDRDGKTALDVVAASGLRAELLRALGAAGRPITAPLATLEDLFGLLRRLGAARAGTNDPEPAPVLALLESEPLLLDQVDAQGRTPLFEAAAQGLGRVAEMLVSRGARVDARDRAGRTPLHGARDASTVRLLVSLGASVDARDADGVTPLQLHAAEPGSLAVVSALIEAGANPRLEDKGRRSALGLARTSGSPDVVAYLERQL